jgi:hypothetical protein
MLSRVVLSRSDEETSGTQGQIAYVLIPRDGKVRERWNVTLSVKLAALARSPVAKGAGIIGSNVRVIRYQ